MQTQWHCSEDTHYGEKIRCPLHKQKRSEMDSFHTALRRDGPCRLTGSVITCTADNTFLLHMYPVSGADNICGRPNSLIHSCFSCAVKLVKQETVRFLVNSDRGILKSIYDKWWLTLGKTRHLMEEYLNQVSSTHVHYRLMSLPDT